MAEHDRLEWLQRELDESVRRQPSSSWHKRRLYSSGVTNLISIKSLVLHYKI